MSSQVQPSVEHLITEDAVRQRGGGPSSWPPGRAPKHNTKLFVSGLACDTRADKPARSRKGTRKPNRFLGEPGALTTATPPSSPRKRNGGRSRCFVKDDHQGAPARGALAGEREMFLGCQFSSHYHYTAPESF